MIGALVSVLHHAAGMAWKIAWGLVLGFAISAVGLAPEPASAAAVLQEPDYFARDYTTWLNFVFLPFGAWLAWLGTREARHP